MKAYIVGVCVIAAALSLSPAYGVQGGGGVSNKQAGQMSKSRTEAQKQIKRDVGKGDMKRVESKERIREEAEGEGLGPQRKEEMQARKEERKQIQEQYKEAKKSGDGTAVKGKKPWWKFWGSDE